MIPGAFFAPMIHEYTKAAVSTAQGDPTPRTRGFLTLNPFKFIEPIGFLMMLFFNGFGWGQPVPTASLHYKNRRKSTLITYLTPIAVNLIIGVLSVMLLSALVDGTPEAFLFAREMFLRSAVWDANAIALIVLFAFAQCNVLLALFNLLPVHPLAMSKILPLFVHADTIVKLNHYEKPLQIGLILLLVFGLIGRLFIPVWSMIIHLAWVF